MYKKVKQQLARDRKLIFARCFLAGGDGISAVRHLGHTLSRSQNRVHTRVSRNDAPHPGKNHSAVAPDHGRARRQREVEFVDDRDTIRQQVVQILTATRKKKRRSNWKVRKRIISQKKEILEGSEEWDVLHKKYYQDELRRMGIAPLLTTATARNLRCDSCSVSCDP